MKQIILDSSCLLRPATFLKTLRASYLFNHSNCSHPSLEVSFFVFVIRKGGNHPFFEVHCAAFICCTTCFHSLSLVVTCCHSLYHSLSLVVIRCYSLYHSLSLVVIRCHALSLDVQLVCLFINDRLDGYDLYRFEKNYCRFCRCCFEIKMQPATCNFTKNCILSHEFLRKVDQRFPRNNF